MTLSEASATLKKEIDQYISVDVETAGPEPGQYALLSIGACRVADESQTFYAELQPDRTGFSPDALAVSRLSLEKLACSGLPPKQVMEQFAGWLEEAIPGRKPVFVAFNAPFDWMFINAYFLRYLGSNPFGHSALDIKALFMGLWGVPWSETSYLRIANRYGLRSELLHNALKDALDQSRIFNKMLADLFTGEPRRK